MKRLAPSGSKHAATTASLATVSSWMISVPDSIGNRRASRRVCFQQFLQLAGVKNVKALDLARPSHHHHLRLPLSINIGEIAGRLIGIVREISQPESFGSGVVSKRKWRRQRSLFRSQPQSSHRVFRFAILATDSRPVYITDLSNSGDCAQNPFLGGDECNGDVSPGYRGADGFSSQLRGGN